MNNSKTVLIASDHAGVALKSEVQKLLSNWKWEDLGPETTDRVDYPDFAEKLSRKIASGEAERGVLICGTGIGMSISANKVHGIRAAAVSNTLDAKMSRAHNDANVLCLGARTLAAPYAAEIIQEWLTGGFEGGRHAGRVEKMMKLENC